MKSPDEIISEIESSPYSDNRSNVVIAIAIARLLIDIRWELMMIREHGIKIKKE
jgi:hypothetical protein